MGIGALLYVPVGRTGWMLGGRNTPRSAAGVPSRGVALRVSGDTTPQGNHRPINDRRPVDFLELAGNRLYRWARSSAPAGVGEGRTMAYDGFISYSHAA